MAGKSGAWDVARRCQVGGEVRLARKCATPWKTLETVYGRSRRQLDRCLGEAAHVTKSREDVTCALLSRAAPRAIDRAMAESATPDATAATVASCANCSSWRREKRPDHEGKGICHLAPPFATTMAGDVCRSHSDLAAAANAALVDKIAHAIAAASNKGGPFRRKGK